MTSINEEVVTFLPQISRPEEQKPSISPSV